MKQTIIFFQINNKHLRQEAKIFEKVPKANRQISKAAKSEIVIFLAPMKPRQNSRYQ